MSTIGSCLRGKKESYNNKKIVKFKFKYFFSQYIYVRYFVINIMKGKKLSEASCWRFAQVVQQLFVWFDLSEMYKQGQEDKFHWLVLCKST